MRAVRGFERPAVQWIFLALAFVLIALVASLATNARRSSSIIRDLRARETDDRRTREQLEARLAREQAMREALALELARLRAGGPGLAGSSAPPTLTLQPLRARDATPPPPTMDALAPAQVIELRLLLPKTAATSAARVYELTVRDWVTGQTRLARAGVKPSRIDGALAVTAYVPGDVFAAGSYEVILRSGQTELATYEIPVR